MTDVTSEYEEVVGEVRAAERSAERAAAFAVTEGFHPLRVRPYVGDPDDAFGGGSGTTARPLIIMGRAEESGPATQDLGLFPAAYAAMQAAQEYPADDEAHEAAAAAAAHGRHRRRRRGIVVAAAAVAASALAAGAVAVTGSVMGEEAGGTDRALPEPASAVPDVTLPADAAPGAVTEPVKVAAPHHPMRATTTPAPRVTPSASSASPTTPSSTPSTSAPATPTTSAPPTTTLPPLPTGSAPAPPTVLQLGASGPEVSDLQQRLTAVWVYHGPVDGRYDYGVQRAVATFQVWYGVQGDPKGVYGPATRTALLRATPTQNTPHLAH
ncbi:peptidoglycan-binding domain-containing protein [Actinacidiphila paucisporea]|uniref:peptidoglycan-binding domain-containing protein n=1 Tax=Actinacidiphila paucisporea TaxID=310782 RepID=UPI00093779EA|nr:peptidoglycan-binding domain-containing protein [Actinacidiphila paucisporea]